MLGIKVDLRDAMPHLGEDSSAIKTNVGILFFLISFIAFLAFVLHEKWIGVIITFFSMIFFYRLYKSGDKELKRKEIAKSKREFTAEMIKYKNENRMDPIELSRDYLRIVDSIHRKDRNTQETKKIIEEMKKLMLDAGK